MKYVQPADPAPVRHLLDNSNDDALEYVDRLLKKPGSHTSVENCWCATPQKPGNPSEYTALQKRNLAELHALEELERLDSQVNENLRDQFL